MGTQQHGYPHFIKACEIVRSGRLGRISLVESWNYANRGQRVGLPADAEPPPGLHWDRWLGAAPYVPYNPARVGSHTVWFHAMPRNPLISRRTPAGGATASRATRSTAPGRGNSPIASGRANACRSRWKRATGRPAAGELTCLRSSTCNCATSIGVHALGWRKRTIRRAKRPSVMAHRPVSLALCAPASVVSTTAGNFTMAEANASNRGGKLSEGVGATRTTLSWRPREQQRRARPLL